jgi:YfiH family protein
MQGTLGPQGAPFVFTDRQDGVSVGPFASLNLSLSTGDERSRVRHNRQLAVARLGRSPQSWLSVTQVHGAQVVQVTGQASAHIEADALITKDKNATLAVLVADCVPIVMVDAQSRAVAAVHAGWRGTAARIAEKAAQSLTRVAACTAQDLWAHVGPAIGPCCFVVDHPVAEALQAAYPSAHQGWTPAGAGRVAIDLWALNLAALTDAGVPPGQVHISRRCTACSPDHFSHRRDGAPSGRQAALIGLP